MDCAAQAVPPPGYFNNTALKSSVPDASQWRNGRERCFFRFARGKAVESGSRQAEAGCETDGKALPSVSQATKPKPLETQFLAADVDGDGYYGKAVAWAVEKGVTTGATATLFRPDATCTRGQIVTFLYRALK